MEDDLKYCKNKRCRRYQVTVFAPNRKYCTDCSSKLKRGWGPDDDTPPLIDGDPSWHAGNNSNQRRNGVEIPTSVTAHTEMVTWAKFQGTHDEYDEYEKEFKSGKFLNWTASGVRVGRTEAGNEDWTCADAEIEGCPLSGRTTRIPRVRVTWAMFQRWLHLCKAFDTEWLAYLKGTKSDEGVFTITDMYFPKQKANGGHVTADDQEQGQILEGTVGSVHSHVNMGAFFSAEDKRHMNHDVEMVVNRRGELAIAVRVQLECGRFSRIESPVLITDIPNVNAEVDIAALKAVLSEEKITSINRGPAVGYNQSSLPTHYQH